MQKSYIPYAILLTAVILFMLYRQAPHVVPLQKTVYDTIIVRDTIRDTIPLLKSISIHHYDTIFLPSASDSTPKRVTIPIEKREYATENYRAIVEGFAPRLTEIEIYPQTRTLVPVATKNRGGRLNLKLGVGIGVGYDPFRREFHPVISLGIYLPLGK